MIKSTKKVLAPVVERRSLRRRVMQFYKAFNMSRWATCFHLVDPKLRDRSKVDEQTYGSGLEDFKTAYGSIRPWHVRISLHLDASSNKHDDRPFAFVYVVWQDAANEFHMFRERWIKHGDKWFTRVAGLVANPGNQ